MTLRTLTNNVLSELSKDQIRFFHLFEAYFDSAPLYVSNLYRDLDWNGNTYIGNGHFIRFEAVEETSNFQFTTVSVSLSGVDQAWIANVLTQQYVDRKGVIYMGFMDDTSQIIVDPFIIFSGVMDAPSVIEDPTTGKSEVVITAASTMASVFDMKSGRHTNDEEQQVYSPGDKIFSLIHTIPDSIDWGRRTST